MQQKKKMLSKEKINEIVQICNASIEAAAYTNCSVLLKAEDILSLIHEVKVARWKFSNPKGVK